MNKEEMNKLVSDLNHEDLLLLKECVDLEIHLSETAINEGFE